MGKKLIELKYNYSEHVKVTRWLQEHANISSVGDLEYDDKGMISVRVPIDDVIYQKYLKQFESEKFEDSRVNQKRNPRGGRLAPPPGWNWLSCK